MKEFFQFVGWVFGFLVPPGVDADPQRQWRWRVKVAVVTMANTAATSICIALALGAAPALFAGFASQTSVKSVENRISVVQDGQAQQLLQVQKNQLDSKIMDTRVRQCAAIKQRDKGVPDAETVLQFTTERIQDELDEYVRLVHHRYRLPDCSEV